MPPLLHADRSRGDAARDSRRSTRRASAPATSASASCSSSRERGRHRLADLPPGPGGVPRPDRPPLERSRQALRGGAGSGPGRRRRARAARPEARASSTPSQSDGYIIPDLIVEKIDGRYQVFLNDTGMPRLRLSRSYQEIARDKKKMTPENREFIASKMNSANWMIQAIEQRRQTMLKVMNFIVDRQRDFFEKGVEYLKPLTLREVAEVINMHESTVSRVTNEKYVQTPARRAPAQVLLLERAVHRVRRGRQRPLDPRQAAEDGRRGGQRPSRSPTSRSCISSRSRGSRSPGARSPSTATSSASCRPGCASGYDPRGRRGAGRQRPRSGQGRGGQSPRVRPALRRGAGPRRLHASKSSSWTTARATISARCSRDLERQYPFLRVVTHRRQRGIADALRSAGDVARGDIFVFYPADLQYLPGRHPGPGARRSWTTRPTSSPAPSRESTRRRSSPASTTGSAAGSSGSGSPISTRSRPSGARSCSACRCGPTGIATWS